MRFRHPKLLGLATFFGTVIVIMAACEIGLRSYHRIMARWQTSVIEEIVLDPRLGWRATEDFSFSGELRDHAGNPYRAEVFTNSNGFRTFGDSAATERARVLFVGDSFTHAIQVSASDAYYSVVGESLGCEVFAYGVGGYGTLQELMVLPGILDFVDPDAVVLQLCSNDLFNNHYALELGSAWNNNGLVRPYWEEGGIVYRLPKPLPGLRRFASEHSEFLYFVFSRFDRITASPDRTGTERRVSEEGIRFRPFAEAVDVTGRLLSKIRNITPANTPVFAFCSDERKHEYGALRSKSEQAGLVFINGVPEALYRAEEDGVCTRAADGGHWSIAGHRVVAGVLTDFLSSERLRVGPDSPRLTGGRGSKADCTTATATR